MFFTTERFTSGPFLLLLVVEDLCPQWCAKSGAFLRLDDLQLGATTCQRMVGDGALLAWDEQETLGGAHGYVQAIEFGYVLSTSFGCIHLHLSLVAHQQCEWCSIFGLCFHLFSHASWVGGLDCALRAMLQAQLRGNRGFDPHLLGHGMDWISSWWLSLWRWLVGTFQILWNGVRFGGDNQRCFYWLHRCRSVHIAPLADALLGNHLLLQRWL